MKNQKKKAIVILGATASGKTAMAVALACKFKGEIISADSRQVYKYMDIGTGKDLEEYIFKSKIKNQKSKIIKIPYHLIDVAHPNEQYDLAKWLSAAKKALQDILAQGKTPIIAGGTGLYAQALVDNFNLSKFGENKELRAELEKKTAQELFVLLSEIDKKFAGKLNHSEQNNKRRLIRYIEINQQGQAIKDNNLKKTSEYEFLLVGIDRPRKILHERIYQRLMARLENENMIGEVAGLHKEQKVSWQRLEAFGLEYKFIAKYLQGKLSYAEMAEKLFIATRQYAKRQMLWLRRWEKQGAKIYWVDDEKSAQKIVEKFLQNKLRNKLDNN